MSRSLARPPEGVHLVEVTYNQLIDSGLDGRVIIYGPYTTYSAAKTAVKRETRTGWTNTTIRILYAETT